MPVHSGPVTAVMILLLVAGAQKLLDPSSTSGALQAAGLPSALALVRALGLVEVGAGVAYLVWGGPLPAAAGALLYAGFGWFVINAIARDLPISSCGCLGATETPPTMIHVVMNLGSLGVLVAAVIIPVAPLGGLVGQELDVLVPHVLFTGATVYLLYALLTVLPLVSKRARVDASTFLPLSRRPAA